MSKILLTISFIFLLSISIFAESKSVTIAISDYFVGLETLSSTTPDAAADQIRNLIFNSLVKKNERFEYVGDLAKDIKIDYKNLTLTFVLNDNVKFHNGKILTSADAKYTLEALFESDGYKARSFFDYKDGKKQPHILSIETPNEKTLVLKIVSFERINQTLSHLIAIPIIPEGSLSTQNKNPVGTGAFKFIKFERKNYSSETETNNGFVELESNKDYWKGSPKIDKLVVKTVTDYNVLKYELENGSIDIVLNPSNMSADTYNKFSKTSNLQVVESEGTNIRYISFNVKSKVVKNAKLRQAIAYAIDREKIVKELFNGQVIIAHSVLPPNSWAYSAEVKYEFNPIKAKKLLKESGYKGQKIRFSVSSGNQMVAQYTQVIQDSLKNIGINVEIESIELNSLLEQLKYGQFQMTTSQWVGGNQDPIFLRDLFETNESPDKKAGGRNRSRYSNAAFDKAINAAVSATDKQKSKELYAEAQAIVAKDLPYIPLWYPKNMVIANKRIGNIKINPSGDWSFFENITILQN